METNQKNIHEQSLELMVLSTLSFYEPMTFAHILLDFDANEIKRFPSLEKEDLLALLKSFERRKKIKKVRINNEEAWIRIYPTRSWWKRIFV